MNAKLRAIFDRELERLLPELPPQVQELLSDVPLVVEDHPSREVMRRAGVQHRQALCGLYTGIPLSERSIRHSGTLPDVVTVYREGILAAARDAEGRLNAAMLREEIRTTILHELAHHHGLDEEELSELGFG